MVQSATVLVFLTSVFEITIYEFILRTSLAPSHALQVFPFKKLITLDGQALAAYDSANETITEWLKETPTVPKPLRVKLEFFRSDILRKALHLARLSQFIAQQPPRDQIRVDELLAALHRWRRQLQLHRGLYMHLFFVAEKLPAKNETTLAEALTRNPGDREKGLVYRKTKSKHLALLPKTFVMKTSTHDRRKFRSQNSDNMQRWTSRGGKRQKGEVEK